MREHVGSTTRGMLGACSTPARWLVGALTLVLGAVCLKNAFVVPCLFGPVAAAVIACERLLCAARSASQRAAGVWSAVALGWLVVAACMLHAPVLSVASLRWLVVLLIASSALCRGWIHSAGSLSQSEPVGIWLVAATIPIQLAALFDGAFAPMSRVAATVAIELTLIGLVSLLQMAALGRERSRSSMRFSRETDVLAAIGFGLEAKIA